MSGLLDLAEGHALVEPADGWHAPPVAEIRPLLQAFLFLGLAWWAPED